MNTLTSIFSENLMNALAWTLLHSLWQGALFAILLGILLVLSSSYSSMTRYFISIFVLALFFSSTLIVFSLQLKTPIPAIKSIPLIEKGLPSPSLPVLPTSVGEPAGEIQSSPENGFYLISYAQKYFERHIPTIVTLWLIGILVCFLRFLGSLAYLQRLRSYQKEVFPTYWLEQVNGYTRQLGINKRIQYLSSRIAPGPMAVGLLRPVVIFPAQLFTGLSESQIKAILIHELAHIKRNDFLVNLCQTLIEILFFYHPGLWWISARIRQERENCCDDLTIALTGEKITYARTLIQLQDAQNQVLSPALNFNGFKSSFSYRIKRLFQQPTVFADYREGLFTGIILILGIVALSFISFPSPGQKAISNDIAPLRPEEVSSRDQPISLKEFLPQLKTSLERGTPSLSPAQLRTRLLKLLFLSIEHKDINLFSYILEKGVDINGRNQQGYTPLMLAIRYQAIDLAKRLLQAGANVHPEAPDGRTALIEAAEQELLEIVPLLIQQGADPNQKTSTGYTAMMKASDQGHYQMVRLFLTLGADSTVKGLPLRIQNPEEKKEGRKVMNQSTLLNKSRGGTIEDKDESNCRPEGRLPRGVIHSIRAPLKASLEIFLVLPKDQMQLRIYFNSQDGKRVRTFIQKSLAKGEHHLKWPLNSLKRDLYWLYIEIDGQVLKQKIGGGCTIQWEPVSTGKTSDETACQKLLNAVKNNDARQVKELLRTSHPDCEFRDDGSPRSPLVAAARNGHYEIAQALLAAEANVEFRTHRDESPLMAASAQGHFDLVKLLVKYGANINREIPGEGTALIKACEQGDEVLVQYLVAQGAKVNGPQGKDGTPLALAVRRNYYNLARFLLEQGAHPEYMASDGNSPEYHVQRLANKRMMKLFDKYSSK